MQNFPDSLFQILIADAPPGSQAFSHALERNIASLKDTYPGATYTRFENEQLIAVIGEHFTKDVLHTYYALRPYAFKADLARYCLLYAYGGLYSDLSYFHLRPIALDQNTEMVVFRDVGCIHPAWAVSNAVIYAKARNRIMENAINKIVAHRRQTYYGLSPLDPTGPYLLGRVLAQCEDWRSIKFGDSQVINRDQTGRMNIIKVMPSGEVVAIRNKSLNSEISELVSSGTNNYAELWEKKLVWNK